MFDSVSFEFNVLLLLSLGLQQGSGLVGAGCTGLWDGSRLPALLCRPAHSDLREDRVRKGETLSDTQLSTAATLATLFFYLHARGAATIKTFTGYIFLFVLIYWMCMLKGSRLKSVWAALAAGGAVTILLSERSTAADLSWLCQNHTHEIHFFCLFCFAYLLLFLRPFVFFSVMV